MKALKAKGPGNQGFIVSSEGLKGTEWTNVYEIIRKKFPDQTVLPNNGKVGSLPIQINAKRSEEVLGIKFRGFEEQVENVIAYYLSLLP